MLKVTARVYDLKDSHSGKSKDSGKEYSFHKQACQINTPENLPDVPFKFQVPNADSFLKAGLYVFDLIPVAGKFGAVDWQMQNPTLKAS